MRQGYTKKEIAVNLRVHRNTITNHLKSIKTQPQYSPEEIVNRLDDRLIREIDDMQHRDLIQYRRSIKQPVIKQETTITGPVLVKWLDDDSNINNKVSTSSKTKTVPQESSKVQDA